MGGADEHLIPLTGYGKAETIQQCRLGSLETGALRSESLTQGAYVRKQQQYNQAMTNGTRRGRDRTSHVTNPRSLLVIVLQEAADSSCPDWSDGKSMT